MSGSAKQSGGRYACGACLVALLAGLLLASTLWSPVSLAQSEPGESLEVIGKDGEVISEGLIFRPSISTKKWSEDKTGTVKFVLKRVDGQRFVDSVKDVKAELNRENVPLAAGSLKPYTEPIKVLFMIDRSRSMIWGGNGVNKLKAAKESLHYFVREIAEPDAQVAIYAFDLEQEQFVALNSNRTQRQQRIDRIDISESGSWRYTTLYCSIEFALEEAKKDGIQDIILLSDGKNDVPDGFVCDDVDRPGMSKSDKEEKLARIARDNGIRIHTVAIGDKRYSEEANEGVDEETLNHISGKTNDGVHKAIYLNEIGSDPAGLENALTEKLKDVLAEIKKHIEFNYEQPVPLSSLREAPASLRLTVTVEKDGKRIPFTVDYDISWDKNGGAPTFNLTRIGRLGLINHKPLIPLTELTQIYFLLFLPLALLLFLPSAVGRIIAARELLRMKNSIEVVGRGSPLQDKQCPNEMWAAGHRYIFREGDKVLVCPKCHTPHHLSCWKYNEHRCMNRVCEYQFAIPERMLNKVEASLETKKRFV